MDLYRTFKLHPPPASNVEGRRSWKQCCPFDHSFRLVSYVPWSLHQSQVQVILDLIHDILLLWPHDELMS